MGATGSIGEQALEVVEQHSDKLSVVLLTANRNASRLIAQSLKHRPRAVVIYDETGYKKVKKALSGTGIGVHAGTALCDLVKSADIDIVLVALVGFAGLRPTLSALEAGKDIALANKETLVVGGNLVKALAAKKKANIYPIDSEHSAIFQCLVGESHHRVEKLILTASGGPFRGKKKTDLKHVTPAEALRHPSWNMGAKISIDSATMMNKGLEIIEAHWLFELPNQQIDLVVHPESIIHSLVVFSDTSTKAQLGLPDMRVPIQYALFYPERPILNVPVMDWTKARRLHFESLDKDTFEAPTLCRNALSKGGNLPCVLNAANEVAVEAFLKGQIAFLSITQCVEKCMNKVAYIANPTYEDYIHTDKETRRYATELCKS